MPQQHEPDALDRSTGGAAVVGIVRPAFTEEGPAFEVNEMTLDADADICPRAFTA